MFRKLKLQFILTNLTIITALFVSLTTGAYILLQIKMINHVEFFAKKFAAGINSGIFPDFPSGDHAQPPHFHNGPPDGDNRPPGFPGFPGPLSPSDRPGLPGPFHDNGSLLPAVFFIKTDHAGGIIFKSFKQPVDTAHLAALARYILKTSQNSGIINLLRSKYFYYKTPLKKAMDLKNPGSLVIFQNLKQEKNIQRSLVISLVITGIVFLILAMAGSLFMAKRAVGPIQTAWQQQKDFLTDASHELRTPLAIIQTNLEVVLNNPQETVLSQMEWLNNVKEELQQMTTLVSSLLFLARVDSKQWVINKADFWLDKMIARVTEAFKPIVTANNIDLITSPTSEIIYYGDESNIRQVIEILLDNAVQHTPAGGKISIQLHRTDQKILLSIADTGEGIAAESLEKIFDRFYQADAARTKGKAGLGLSIAKLIIENHGGTIHAASQPGSGTTFTIQLPLPKNNS
jgi:signal transduction histidine kinase